MLRPSPAELLAGVAEALEETVLTDLVRGQARNQVQAAVGIVRRCAAAIDDHGPLLHAECLDLNESLRAIAAADARLVADRTALDEPLARAAELLAGGYPPVSALTEVGLALREQLASMAVRAEAQASPQRTAISELFDRMLTRELELGMSPW